MITNVFTVMETLQSTGDKTSYSDQSKLFRGFSDPSRLYIIEALGGWKQKCRRTGRVNDLSQPNVSNHLRGLADCGLLKNERDDRHIYCRLSDSRIDKILTQAEMLPRR